MLQTSFDSQPKYNLVNIANQEISKLPATSLMKFNKDSLKSLCTDNELITVK